MAGFVGADIQQLEQLAAAFGQQAQQLSNIKSTIGSKVRSTVGTHWRGNDATQFLNMWDSQFAPNLQKVIESLQQAQQAVNRNKAEQMQASGN